MKKIISNLRERRNTLGHGPAPVVFKSWLHVKSSSKWMLKWCVLRPHDAIDVYDEPEEKAAPNMVVEMDRAVLDLIQDGSNSVFYVRKRDGSKVLFSGDEAVMTDWLRTLKVRFGQTLYCRYANPDIRRRCFTLWLNAHLQSHSTKVADLFVDIRDGNIILKLLQAIFKKSISGVYKNPKNDSEALKNVKKMLAYFHKFGGDCTGIEALEIVKGERQSILEIIWRIVAFLFDTGKQKDKEKFLFKWIKEITGVRVRALSSGFEDGKVFLLIAMALFTDKIDMNAAAALMKVEDDVVARHRMAFASFQEFGGIPQLLSPYDFIQVPDDISLFTFLTWVYHVSSQFKVTVPNISLYDTKTTAPSKPKPRENAKTSPKAKRRHTRQKSSGPERMKRAAKNGRDRSHRLSMSEKQRLAMLGFEIDESSSMGPPPEPSASTSPLPSDSETDSLRSENSEESLPIEKRSKFGGRGRSESSYAPPKPPAEILEQQVPKEPPKEKTRQRELSDFEMQIQSGLTDMEAMFNDLDELKDEMAILVDEIEESFSEIEKREMQEAIEKIQPKPDPDLIPPEPEPEPEPETTPGIVINQEEPTLNLVEKKPARATGPKGRGRAKARVQSQHFERANKVTKEEPEFEAPKMEEGKFNIGKLYIKFIEVDLQGQTCYTFCTFGIGQPSPQSTAVSQKSKLPYWSNEEQHVLDVIDGTQSLIINVHHRLHKEDFLTGTATIELKQGIRDSMTEFWAPIDINPDISGVTRGNIHLKLAYLRYTGMIERLIYSPAMSLPLALAKCLPTPEVSGLLMRLYANHGMLFQFLTLMIRDEVNSTVKSQTLFRTDTIATKMLKAVANQYGKKWLISSLQPLVKAICANPGQSEVDPRKVPEGETREQNFINLTASVQKFITAMTDSSKVPVEIRTLCSNLKQIVGNKFPQNSLNGVSSFVFLRFFCPALFSPAKSGLVTQGEVSPQARRHLLLVAKIIQNMANGVNFKKEAFMMEFNPLIEKQLPQFRAFLDDISEPDPRRKYKQHIGNVHWDAKSEIAILDSFVLYLKDHSDPLLSAAQKYKMILLWLTAEVELKFAPVLTLQQHKEEEQPADNKKSKNKRAKKKQ